MFAIEVLVNESGSNSFDHQPSFYSYKVNKQRNNLKSRKYCDALCHVSCDIQWKCIYWGRILNGTCEGTKVDDAFV